MLDLANYEDFLKHVQSNTAPEDAYKLSPLLKSVSEMTYEFAQLKITKLGREDKYDQENFTVENLVQYSCGTENQNGTDFIRPSELYLNRLNPNRLGFQISFVTTDVTIATKERSYNFYSLLADTGGIIGLCIGMSITSIVEFVELFFVLFVSSYNELELSYRSNRVQNFIK